MPPPSPLGSQSLLWSKLIVAGLEPARDVDEGRGAEVGPKALRWSCGCKTCAGCSDAELSRAPSLPSEGLISLKSQVMNADLPQPVQPQMANRELRLSFPAQPEMR